MSLSDVQSYAWIISLSSLGAVFIGWKVVYRNAKKISTRTESKSITDHLIKLCNEIIDLSVSFWMKEDDDDRKESLKFSLAVSAKSTQIGDFFEILANRGITIDSEFLADFTSAATLDSERKSGFSDDERAEKCQACVDHGMSLISHIYKKFEVKYPPQKDLKISEIDYYLEHFESYCHGCSKPYIDKGIENGKADKVLTN
ncbi:Uncharacterised protein [Lelliottia amnigena]|uniref:hypothetical protein n=1 Tax=Lelliottia amnigena TaxID=61646 RepID=UPI0007431F66|nr:hypothetical protein [Lelliottia amnigena]ATG01271.1 hypothetical protein CO697_06570 [Lelliottia amnigena]PEG63389.1 hypothetical protein CRH15_16710 [Lelliottia amnigena]QXA21566.1 hypothetical protein I6L74_19575 [Lelliottia amnigena]VDZ89224.1 Uncharacterised protein [Lelliottia amnigena]